MYTAEKALTALYGSLKQQDTEEFLNFCKPQFSSLLNGAQSDTDIIGLEDDLLFAQRMC